MDKKVSYFTFIAVFGDEQIIAHAAVEGDYDEDLTLLQVKEQFKKTTKKKLTDFMLQGVTIFKSWASYHRFMAVAPVMKKSK